MNNGYHGNEELKQNVLKHMAWHRDQDMVSQGSYGNEKNGKKWRGCSVACGLRSLDMAGGTKPRGYANSHSELAERMGIPFVLARLNDRVFEGLPSADAKGWPLRFSSAIPVGRDLSQVWDRLALWLLVDAESGVLRFAKTAEQQSAIKQVAALYERRLSGDEPTRQEWVDARCAAYVCADYCAAVAAVATAAAVAAVATAAAVAHAHAVVVTGAYADARSAFWVRIGDKLIEFMESA